MDALVKNKIYYFIHDYLMIVFGTLLYGFGFNAFILSNEIVTGGLSGLCALIFFATNGLIPVSVSYFIINAGLLLLALKVLGLKYLIKTIVGVISLSASFSFFEWLLQGYDLLPNEPFMAILIGASLCGSGLGLVFSANGSTGGTDIIASIVNKYKNLSIGRILLLCDFFIISSSWVLFHDVEKIVFGFVEMVVSNYILDFVLNGNRQSVQFLIFSPKYDEIAEQIISKIGRGCTILDGQGGYSRKPVKVVVGGATRQESVLRAALEARADAKLLAVQDGARPLVTPELFDAVILRAAVCAAAAPAVPVHDTIKLARDRRVTETPDRSMLFAVQTPQVFDAGLLKAALQSALTEHAALTDDCSAVERLGKAVYLTDGDEENIKITTPLDLIVAETILRRREEREAEE